MRRSAGVSQPTIQFNSICINISAQTVLVDDQELELTAYEYKVIEYLVMNSDKVISKMELTEHIYGYRWNLAQINSGEVSTAS